MQPVARCDDDGVDSAGSARLLPHVAEDLVTAGVRGEYVVFHSASCTPSAVVGCHLYISHCAISASELISFRVDCR